jgi:Immunity protein 61
MTGRIEIPARLEEWGKLAGYSLTSASPAHDGRTVFWSAGGEVRFYVGASDDGWFVITRAERMGPEHFQLAAPSMDTIQRYFFGDFGSDIRSNRGLPIVAIPESKEEVSAGFTIDNRLFEGAERLALISSDGSTVAISGSGKLIGTAELVDLSLCLTATIDDIIASSLDPDGKPLFKNRRLIPRGRGIR